MKPTSLCLLLVTLLGVLHPVFTQAQDNSGGQSSQPVDPIVGRWRWFTNEFVFIKPDGTLTKGGGVIGRWRCVNGMEWPRKYVLNWGGGMWVDTLNLRNDCSVLNGMNQQHHWVHASRSDGYGSADTGGASLGLGATEAAGSGLTPLVVVPEQHELRMRRLEERTALARASYHATLSGGSSPTLSPPGPSAPKAPGTFHRHESPKPRKPAKR